MSELINKFRSEHPQYDGIEDSVLVPALHKKFYSSMPFEQFSQKVGYQPQPLPIQQEELPISQAEALPIQQQNPTYQQESLPVQGEILPTQDVGMLDLIGQKLKNMGAGAGERAGDVLGSLLGTVQTVGEGLEESIPLGGFVWQDGDILPSYKSPEEFAKADAPPVFEKASKVLEGIDLGYQESVGWQDVKDSFSKGGALSGSAYADVLEYGLEQGIKSVPDMVSAIYALPAYIFARSGEIGDQRAVNKGKDKADITDVLEAAPFAVASSLLERIGAKGMTEAGKAELGKDILKAGLKESSKRVAASGGKALTKEAATEAIQEGMIEYVGEKYGTKSAMDWGEALDRAVAGAVAGGVMGGTGGLATSTAREINYSPTKQLAREIEIETAKADLGSVDQGVIDSLTPNEKQPQGEQEKQAAPKIEVKEKASKEGEFKEGVKASIIEEGKESPIEKEEPTNQKVAGKEVVEAPIDEVALSEDVPQFKSGADRKGVVEPLGGSFERTGVAPIQVWVRNDGSKEVISGRHRLDLAKRSGEKSIPAQYHYESEGFGLDQAAVLDATLNIREGQGKVKDYVDFIKATKPREEEAKSQGLLARQTGKRAFTIATKGSDELVASHRNDQVTDEAAERIANAAPKSSKLQSVGIKAIQDGKSISIAENLIKAVSSMSTGGKGNADLFGFDDSAMIEAEALAKKATTKQAEIQKTLSAIQGAAKNPDLAKKEGVNVKNAKAVNARIKSLKDEKAAWQNWHTNPKLVTELKGDGFSLDQETESQRQQRETKEQEATAEQERQSKKEQSKAEADKEVGEFTLTGSDRSADVAMSQGQQDLLSGETPISKETKASAPELETKPSAKEDYANDPAKAYQAFMESVANQTATAGDIKSDAESIVANKEKIIGKLSDRKFTKAMLQELIRSPRNDLSKPQMVKSAYEGMLSAHAMGSVVTAVFGGSKTYEEQIMEKINSQTQADVDAAYEKQREYRAEIKKRRDELSKSLSNPETLAEFKEFIRVRGKEKMTAEQLASYDELVSESIAEAKPETIKGESDTVKTERAKTKHTKTGEDLFVVKMAERVDKEKFRELSAKAKSLGGYYSSYSKGDAIPGFQFKTDDAATQFEQLLSGKDIDKSDFNEAKAEVKQSKAADRLLEMAENMEDKATEEINRPRQANTARRASMAASATERAEKQLALAKTVRNIAVRLGEGDLTHLGKLSQVTQLEELISIQSRAIPDRLYESSSFDGYSIRRPLKDGVTVDDYIASVSFPKIEVNERNIEKVSDKLKGKKGFARLSAELKRLPAGRREDIRVLNEEQFSKLKEAAKKDLIDSYDIGGFAEDQYKTLSRIKRLGITTEEQLRAAIRELDSLKVAENKADPIKALERDLVGQKIDGFFPTPKALVDQMIDYADIQPGHEVLEPSAGKGNIAQEIQQAAPDAILEVVEYNAGLRALLEAKGYKVVGNDFLETKKKYDRIVMNPPFENFQDIDHVKHAYNLLKPGGKLVAIMGAGVKNSRSKAVEFREWLDDMGSYIEDLPEGSFKSSERSTGVNTVMVTIEKNDTNTLNYKKEDKENSIESLKKQIEEIDGVETIRLFGRKNGDISLDTIIIDEESRGKGLGSKVLKMITKYADERGQRVVLSPAIEGDFKGTTSRSRLVKFYKSFGFVENKGRKKDFEISEGMYRDPEDGAAKIFHAPGHNFIGMYRSMGIPERRDFVRIEGRKVKIPESPQRIEPIMRKIVQIAGRRIYFGKIKGKSTEGFYRPNVGEIRTRRKNDVEVLAHELAHYLDMYSNIRLPNFKKLYRDKKYSSEVKALSYTDATESLQEIEGFAEFVRLWLTNATEAQARAPKFYEAFTYELARDRKLLNPMRDMQDLMHKFYFQGPDKLGQSLIGKSLSYRQRFSEWRYRRDSRIRQQLIDRFHAARKIEQVLTKKIGDTSESAWKQLRIANGGSEGISDYILNYGTVNFDEKGDLKRTGASLNEILQPVKTVTLKPEHKGEQKIDLLMRYFAGRRALELHRQGRENLIPKETAMEWARLGKSYPQFESIHKDYQAFNDRMMDFYQESGMITPEARKSMQSMNNDYVPFNRIRDQLAGGKGGSSGFQRLKGGTANLNDILVNIQDGVTANVRSALNNRAKQRLYQYISNHKDGAIFATRISTDSRKVKVYQDEMKSKIEKVLEENGVQIDGDLDLDKKGLLEFWQHGVKPQVNESGNIVDSVIINGKPKYYEVQDELLQEMLLSMNPESYSSFMNIMFGIKNIFTRSITLGIEFTGANLVRDTIGASFLSKNGFVPFISSFRGMYSFIRKDKDYQDFMRSGGGYSSRIEAATREGTARRRVSVDEFGVMTGPEKILSTIDNIASAFEYGTRIGEFRLAKRNSKSDMDAGFAAREISTDFSAIGANRFITGYIRTVPFLNAMIQSQDRVFREVAVSNKYDGNPSGLAMKAFLGITVPTIMLYLLNKDDDDYKEIPDYEKRTNWHIKIGDGKYVKIPRPYDVGFVFATMPELFFKYLEDEKGKEFADGMMWTMTQMYGIDGVPAIATGWWDLVRNEKWTGAPVVPQSLADVEAPDQYTSNTSETFIRLGEALGLSPIKAEHTFKSYTGYLGGYLLAGTDRMLWDESKFGDRVDSQLSDNVFLKRFLTPSTRPSTAAMEKFFNLKEKSDSIVSTFKQEVDIRRSIIGKEVDKKPFKDDKFYGLSAEEKKVLFALNDSMNDLIKLIYGKEGIKTAELTIKHNKRLTGEQKRKKIDELWRAKSDMFLKYYEAADRAIQKAKIKSKKEK